MRNDINNCAKSYNEKVRLLSFAISHLSFHPPPLPLAHHAGVWLIRCECQTINDQTTRYAALSSTSIVVQYYQNALLWNIRKSEQHEWDILRSIVLDVNSAIILYCIIFRECLSLLRSVVVMVLMVCIWESRVGKWERRRFDWLTEWVSVHESSVYRPISDWITNSNNLSTIEKECVRALYTSLLLFIKSFSSLWGTRNTHMTQAQNIVIYLWFCLYMPTFAWFHTNLPSPCLHFSCCH